MSISLDKNIHTMNFQHLSTHMHRGQITLFGRNAQGQSVAAHTQAQPILVVSPLPPNMAETLLRYSASKRKNINVEWYIQNTPLPYTVTRLQGQNIVNYDEDHSHPFWEIKCHDIYTFYNLKRLIREKCKCIVSQRSYDGSDGSSDTLKQWVDRDWITGWGICQLQTTLYNDQLNPCAQYLVENDIHSCDTIAITGSPASTTHCDLEYSITAICKAEEQYQAPFKLFSYDIECYLRTVSGKLVFPAADKDPIITIGVVVGDTVSQKTSKHVFCLHETPDIEGIDVHWFPTETQLLREFCSFVQQQDPDFILGHNINRFDNVYFRDRCKLLDVSFDWSRRRDYKCTIREIVTQSNQKGTQEVYRLDVPGRVVLDTYEVFRAQHKLRSYKLDAIGEHFLNQRKVDLPYAEIPKKFQTGEGRQLLATYCVQDSNLVLNLVQTQYKVINTMQMANVCGVDPDDILQRGQGIRTISLMLRYAKTMPQRLFIPRGEDNEDGFKGAVVLPPQRGIYTDAVICVDFASLYPSIMLAMNMSYETLIDNETVERMGWQEDQQVRSVPDYDYKNNRLVITHAKENCTFVTTDVREGLLPKILRSVLTERKAVKKQMKQHYGTSMHAVLDGKQQALKVVANSIYGFTGAKKGYLSEPKIASSVTKYGRGLTLRTMDFVDNHPDWKGSNVIYGDTDSCFIRLSREICDGKDNKELIANAHRVGTMMGEEITQMFLSPVLMEYESAFEPPFVLLKKKRYFGKLCLPGRAPKPYLKGVECIRRDFAPIVVSTQRRMIELILENKLSEAETMVRETFRRLYAGEIPLQELTMCKKLSQLPENYKTKSPHVELAKRQQASGRGPKAGDRVEYLIRAGFEDLNQRSIAPEEVDKYVIDYNYYAEKQLRKPLERILELATDTDDIFQQRHVSAATNNSGIVQYLSVGKRRGSGSGSGEKVYTKTKKRKITDTDIRNFFD